MQLDSEPWYTRNTMADNTATNDAVAMAMFQEFGAQYARIERGATTVELGARPPNCPPRMFDFSHDPDVVSLWGGLMQHLDECLPWPAYVTVVDRDGACVTMSQKRAGLRPTVTVRIAAAAGTDPAWHTPGARSQAR